MSDPTFVLANINHMATVPSITAAHADTEGEDDDIIVVLPLANLKTEDPGDLARVERITGIDGLVLNFGTWDPRVPVQAVALIATNLQPGDSATVELVGAGGITLATREVQAHLDPDLGYSSDLVTNFPQVYDVQFISWTINTPDTSRTIFDCGVAWAGPVWKPQHGIDYQVRPAIDDSSETAYTRGRQPRTNVRRPYKMSMINFPALREHELIGAYGSDETCLYDIFMRNGAHRHVLAFIFGDGDAYSAARNFVVAKFSNYGLMSSRLDPGAIGANAGERIWTLQAAITQSLGVDYSAAE